MITKYDKIVQPVWFNGEIIGHMVQKRTAEEYAKDYWEICKFKKLWYETVNSSTNVFKTPIIEADNE